MKTVKQTQMHNQVCVDEAGDAAAEQAHRAEAHRAEACRETTHLANLVSETVVEVADKIVEDKLNMEKQKVSVL